MMEASWKRRATIESHAFADVPALGGRIGLLVASAVSAQNGRQRNVPVPQHPLTSAQNQPDGHWLLEIHMAAGGHIAFARSAQIAAPSTVAVQMQLGFVALHDDGVPLTQIGFVQAARQIPLTQF